MKAVAKITFKDGQVLRVETSEERCPFCHYLLSFQPEELRPRLPMPKQIPADLFEEDLRDVCDRIQAKCEIDVVGNFDGVTTERIDEK